MALTDILTIPFLMCLGITLVLIGVLGYLFMQRVQEQNHKITSMFELVNTMVEEMNFLKGRLQVMSYNTAPHSFSQNIHQSGSGAGAVEMNLSHNLIQVSDNEDDTDDDENDEDDDSNSDEDSDDSDDNDEDSDSDTDDNDKTKIELFSSDSQNVKIINFHEIAEESKKNDNESEFSELDNADDIDSDDTDNSDSENDNDESEENGEPVKIIDMSETINLDNNDIFELSKKMEIHSNETDFLKNITKTIDLSDISDNLEDSNNVNVIDYKKMSLNKLKEIAISKGLIAESSKATKNAILKLLNNE
jgi:hypothetical protein